MSSVAQEGLVAKGLFFDYLFGVEEGFICVATAKPDRTGFAQTFFEWPHRRAEMLHFIEQRHKARNVWFGISLLKTQERSRGNSLPMSFLWADLDETHPNSIPKEIPEPSMLLESSPGRYQAFWRLSELIDPLDAQELSKRLAYAVSADHSGWDLEQILRIPLTFNHKYLDSPAVKLLYAKDERISVDAFTALPVVLASGVVGTNLPAPPPEDELPYPDLVLYKYQNKLFDTGFDALHNTVLDENDDWSKKLWRLINICMEVGMSDEESFAIARVSQCNKYERDKRPEAFLWQEVLKVRGNKTGERNKVTGDIKLLDFPQLIDSEYRPTADGFVQRYREWAEQSTDAVPGFHDLSALILLSALVSSGVELRAKWGKVYANLWGLVLGDSTLSRKTTAMRMAMDILLEIDRDLILSTTEGSMEGMFTGLNGRPNMVSIFFKDEVSGFFDSLNKKDYLAGMPELLTDLYDVPSYRSRILRKEVIQVSYPYFIFFGGGIKDKVYSLIPESFVLSGFLPRFLIVLGDTDLSRLKPTGPATTDITTAYDDMVNELRQLHAAFNEEIDSFITGQPTKLKITREVKMESDCWRFFNEIENKLTLAAYDSHLRDLALPTFQRLSFSILKIAMLIAIARQGKPDDNQEVTINMNDMKDAAYYGQIFGRNSIELIKSAGISTSERQLEAIHRAVIKRPGVTRSELMQRHRLRSREATDIITTLLERGVIVRQAKGSGVAFYPTEIP